MLLTRHHVGDFDLPLSYKVPYGVVADVDVFPTRRNSLDYLLGVSPPGCFRIPRLDGHLCAAAKRQDAANEKCLLLRIHPIQSI